MSYHGRVAEFERGTLWIGGALGFAAFENERSFDVFTLPSGNTIDGSYSANLFRLTPSVSYRLPLGSQVEAFATAGAGLYSISLIEKFDGFSDDLDSETTLGGFLSVGIDFQILDSPFSIRLEDQVHFLEIDAFERTLPADSTVDGPLHQFLLGIAIRL